jgi:xylulokinase
MNWKKVLPDLAPDLFLGLDLGTSSCKGVLYSSEGRPVFEEVEFYSFERPEPDSAEQDSGDWWTAILRILKKSAEFSNSNGGLVRSIALCGQRESVVPVDRNDNAIGNSILWLDRRSTLERDKIRRAISEEELYLKTGLVASPLFVAPKVMWLKEKKPKIYDKAFKFLLAKDFINLKLTGEYSTDFTLASRTLLFDISRGEWNDDLFKLFEVDRDKFPEVIGPGEQVGCLTTKVALSLGLPKNTVVASGAGDAPCAAYGCDVLSTGEACEISGTSSLIEAVTDRRTPVYSADLLLTQHVLKEKKLLEGGVATSGAIIKWFFEIVEGRQNGHDNSPSDLEEQVHHLPRSLDDPIVLPYFAGSTAKRNPDARGVIFGLTPAHDRAHIFRAILEGVALAIRETVDACGKQGANIRFVKSVGGGSKSQYWADMKASATRVPFFSFPKVEAGCFGGAKLAAEAIGEHIDSHLVATYRADPQGEWSQMLDQRYTIFSQLYRQVLPCFSAFYNHSTAG